MRSRLQKRCVAAVPSLKLSVHSKAEPKRCSILADGCAVGRVHRCVHGRHDTLDHQVSDHNRGAVHKRTAVLASKRARQIPLLLRQQGPLCVKRRPDVRHLPGGLTERIP